MSCMTMCMTGCCGIQVPVRYSYISTSYYYSHKFRAALYYIEIHYSCTSARVVLRSLCASAFSSKFILAHTPWIAGGYLQIPIFEYRSIYRLVPRSVQCCQLPCYHGRDPLPTCMVLASNQVVRTRALVHAQTWSPRGAGLRALLWSSGMPPPAAGGGGRF